MTSRKKPCREASRAAASWAARGAWNSWWVRITELTVTTPPPHPGAICRNLCCWTPGRGEADPAPPNPRRGLMSSGPGAPPAELHPHRLSFTAGHGGGEPRRWNSCLQKALSSSLWSYWSFLFP